MNLRRNIAEFLARHDLAVVRSEPTREQVIADANQRLAELVAAAQPRAQQYTRNRDAQKRRSM